MVSRFFRAPGDTLNPYPRFLGKNPKRGTIAERVFRKKIQSEALHHFVYVPMFWNFFPEIALGDGPKKWHVFLFSTANFPSYWRAVPKYFPNFSDFDFMQIFGFGLGLPIYDGGNE